MPFLSPEIRLVKNCLKSDKIKSALIRYLFIYKCFAIYDCIFFYDYPNQDLSNFVASLIRNNQDLSNFVASLIRKTIVQIGTKKD